ncbi:MAG TPA: hypothetical protein VIS74_03585 [Chthoniobacterales bacterium]
MKRLLAIFSFFLAATWAVAQPVLIVVAEGKQVALSPADAARLILKIEDIVVSANFNSRDHPADYFKEGDYWRPISKIQKGSYIRITYPEGHVFKTAGGEISAKDVWIDLPHEARSSGGAVYPGPITLINGEDRILLTKESGYLVLGLGLDPAIYPHLPKILQENMDRGRKAYEEFEKKKNG